MVYKDMIRVIVTPIIKNYIKKNPKVIYSKEAALALDKTLKKAIAKVDPNQSFSALKPHMSSSGNIITRPSSLFDEIFATYHPKATASTKADIKTLLEKFKKKNPKFDFGGQEKAVATKLTKEYQKLHPKNPSLVTAEGKASKSFREVWNDLELPVLTPSERGKLFSSKNLIESNIGGRSLYPNLDAYTKQFLRRHHSELDEGSSEFKGIAEMIEQAIRRKNAKEFLDIKWGPYSKSQKIKKTDRLEQNLFKDIENEKFMQKYYDEVYPYRNKASDYINLADESFGADLTRYQDEVYDYMRARGMTEESIQKMFPPYFKTLGHKGPVSASYLDFLRTTNPDSKFFSQQLADMGMSHPSLKVWESAAKPRMWQPEIGVANKAKDITDRIIFGGLQQEGLIHPSQLKGIDQMRHLYGDVGISSLIRGKPIGEGFDLAKQADFIRKQVGRDHDIFTGPFGHSANDWAKLRRQWMNMLIRGDRTYKDVLGFQAGGLVGIGSKILAKLVNKLSEKEMKMLMGSLWKGVDPKQSGRYKAWAKNRWGPGYKWPYQKSRIRGPEMKKSHYASLSDQAKEDLRKRYAKRLAEYIARKKRGQ